MKIKGVATILLTIAALCFFMMMMAIILKALAYTVATVILFGIVAGMVWLAWKERHLAD